jgi:hypothetical protein
LVVYSRKKPRIKGVMVLEMIGTAADLEMRTNQSHLGFVLDYRGRIACLSAATPAVCNQMAPSI